MIQIKEKIENKKFLLFLNKLGLTKRLQTSD